MFLSVSKARLVFGTGFLGILVLVLVLVLVVVLVLVLNLANEFGIIAVYNSGLFYESRKKSIIYSRLSATVFVGQKIDVNLMPQHY